MIQRLGMDIKKAQCLLGTSRPTAVNLAWALDKVVKLINFTITPIFPPTIFSIANNCTIDIFKVSESEDMEKAAMAIHSDDVQLCRRLGQVLSSENNLNVLAGFTNHENYQAGASLLNGGILTICNTGALATGGHGTALGMVSTISIMCGTLS